MIANQPTANRIELGGELYRKARGMEVKMKEKSGNSGDIVFLEEWNRPEVVPEGKDAVERKIESE